MNKKHVIVFSLILMAVVNLNAVTLSILNGNLDPLDPSDFVNVAVASNGPTTANIQTRYFSATDWASSVQSFQWNSTNALSAIGVKVNSSQASWLWERDQAYRILIREGDDANMTNSRNLDPVAMYDFTLTSAVVNAAAGHWLQLDLPVTNLTQDNWYSFQIHAIALDTENRLWLSRHANGHGNHIWVRDTVNHPFEGAFPSTSTTLISVTGDDLAFYAVAIPEPATVGLISGVIALLLVGVRKRAKVTKAQ